ncbi:hypothetical protein GCM10027515_09540 [Schumannella luteola]|uniref:AcrR family transcriptional regulator n=1 Tax=Schumannella luteola TaxID=472059 RepID=A0A852Y6A6_9MICO|nr:TetR family transcriptional regulator [Schumannella luteola]NYG97402.1 AcrR family transcriptional regulator [Schumannella luteola]TPX01648.1 TetR family transcriptional regulator [Schumannella luteola]
MANEVRDRSREILRAEFADAAATFCAEHGFDEVTVDEIAHGIGISRATFFRYFASKEDAVVSASRGSAGAYARRVAETPVEPGMTAWQLLRAAAESMVAASEERGDVTRARIRMITDVPALKGRLAWERRNEQSSLADALRERLGDDRTARALAAAAVSAADLAWQEWARTPRSKLSPLLDAYFAAFSGLAEITLD